MTVGEVWDSIKDLEIWQAFILWAVLDLFFGAMRGLGRGTYEIWKEWRSGGL